MANPPLNIFLANEADTDRLAQCLAGELHLGDTVLLDGSIGAGKTQFCRAFIRARLGTQEDIPSPTFTLVQTYDADVEIWHADLYRLTHPDEARELGLEDAFERAICLVEWPERLGPNAPPNAITIKLAPHGDGRMAKVDVGNRPAVAAKLSQTFATDDRPAACDRLLERSGWHVASRAPLAGDASGRRYDRLTLHGKTRILMDQPPGSADHAAPFARIARHLLDIGLSAPVIHAEDMAQGFLLIEDFGDDVFARLMDQDPSRQSTLYRAAVDVLAHIGSNPPAPDIPDLTVGEWADAAGMVLDCYRFAITGDKAATTDFCATLEDALGTYADGPKVMILRDYHAENLMWLPERDGLQRVGLLDFQLAQMGQSGYDLVSLLQDARRDVPPEIELSMIRHFLEATGTTEAAFLPAYAVLGAQRALRILGIFARLTLVAAKPGYLKLIPRVWQQLQRNLNRPELGKLRDMCDLLLPEPLPENLDRIRVQCGNFQ